MAEVRAPGLPGDWINGWLAALGITVLVRDVRLRWSEDRVPVAIFATGSEGDLADAIAASLPSPAGLTAMAIADLKRNVDLVQYAAAAERARHTQDFSLGSSVTDLAEPSSSGGLQHSQFDASAPRGETLWTRLRRCREGIGDGEPVEDAVRHSLAGVGTRVLANGLGFDFKRIAQGDHGEKLVDPVVECLAFFGLAFFPVRGTGREKRLRGWRDAGRGTALAWPTWSVALDRWAIDALLGQIFRADASTWRRRGIGITATFETVRYRPSGAMDQTRAFASRRVP
jgi:hypothetical protein